MKSGSFEQFVIKRSVLEGIETIEVVCSSIERMEVFDSIYADGYEITKSGPVALDSTSTKFIAVRRKHDSYPA